MSDEPQGLKLAAKMTAKPVKRRMTSGRNLMRRASPPMSGVTVRDMHPIFVPALSPPLTMMKVTPRYPKEYGENRSESRLIEGKP
jgi:hypothetical protein